MDPEVQSEMSDASRHFWQEMAAEMVKNSEQLLSQVETFFTMRPPQDGFPPIMVFGVFMCGNVFSYLWKWPEREMIDQDLSLKLSLSASSGNGSSFFSTFSQHPSATFRL